MNSRHRYSLLVFMLLLFVVACCNPPATPSDQQILVNTQYGHALIVISEDFDENDVDLIKSGVDLWVRASQGLYAVEYISERAVNSRDILGQVLDSKRCRDVIIFEMLTSFDQIVLNSDREGDQLTLGLGDHNNCGTSHAFIVVDRLHTDHLFKVVVAHEFGHAIGLDHVETARNIMYSTVGDLTRPCIQYGDAIEFCSKMQCQVEELLFCTEKNNSSWKMPFDYRPPRCYIYVALLMCNFRTNGYIIKLGD